MRLRYVQPIIGSDGETGQRLGAAGHMTVEGHVFDYILWIGQVTHAPAEPTFAVMLTLNPRGDQTKIKLVNMKPIDDAADEHKNFVCVLRAAALAQAIATSIDGVVQTDAWFVGLVERYGLWSTNLFMHADGVYRDTEPDTPVMLVDPVDDEDENVDDRLKTAERPTYLN